MTKLLSQDEIEQESWEYLVVKFVKTYLKAKEDVETLADIFLVESSNLHKQLLAYKPPKKFSEDEKQFAISLVKEADRIIKAEKEIREAAKQLKEHREDLIQMLKSYHLLSDEDLE